MGIVPLFLIRFAHKNAGRGSLVNIAPPFDSGRTHPRALPDRHKKSRPKTAILVSVGEPGIEPGPLGPKPSTLPLCYTPMSERGRELNASSRKYNK